MTDTLLDFMKLVQDGTFKDITKTSHEAALELLIEAVIEIAKWEVIKQSETIENLQGNIMEIADEDGTIPYSLDRKRDAKTVAERVPLVVNGDIPAQNLTRTYGIRQQALYLKYYTELEKCNQ